MCVWVLMWNVVVINNNLFEYYVSVCGCGEVLSDDGGDVYELFLFVVECVLLSDVGGVFDVMMVCVFGLDVLDVL